jgi:hypothetical protein
MIATLIATGVQGMPPGTNLYQLDEPIDGFEFVDVCSAAMYDQTFVIGCNSEGFVEATSMEGIWHCDEFVSHADALAAVGYTEEVTA